MPSKTSIQYATAVAMLATGSGLSIAGFIVPPTGEISDSVLWFFAQCLIYAGSIFGIGIYVKGRFDAFARQLRVPPDDPVSSAPDPMANDPAPDPMTTTPP